MGRKTSQHFAIERHGSLGRAQKPRKHGKECRLAGTIGPDNRKDLVPFNVEAHAIDGHQAAELHFDVTHLEHYAITVSDALV